VYDKGLSDGWLSLVYECLVVEEKWSRVDRKAQFIIVGGACADECF